LTLRDKQSINKADLLEEVVRISHLAGKLLKDRFLTDFLVEHKGEMDLVTEMDRSAQDLIEKEIRSRHPDHGILAEEDLEIHGSTGFQWIVDPLDGTTNYAHRFPVFSTSIAVTLDGETLCGVVYNPISEELFKAYKGAGASLNGCPVKVSGTGHLEDSLLGTGFSARIRKAADNNIAHFGKFALKTQGIRRCGSAALDLCFVACGRLDGYWELGLKPWDIAAGLLIVTEAGGVTTDFDGNDLRLDGSRVLASNGRIHEEMLQILQRKG